jgi:hypothetical protein
MSGSVVHLCQNTASADDADPEGGASEVRVL